VRIKIALRFDPAPARQHYGQTATSCCSAGGFLMTYSTATNCRLRERFSPSSSTAASSDGDPAC
jgi:hypothetical protein